MDPRITRRIRKLIAPFRKIGLKKEFTIFSNNCWGGRVYDKFAIQYLTPTIGLFMEADAFLRFVLNYEHYINCDVVPIDDKQERINNEHGLYYGLIDDLVVKYIHYRDINDAIEKWNRRKKRIVKDNIIVKVTYISKSKKEDEDFFDLFSKLGYKKIIFTNSEFVLNRNDLGYIVYLEELDKNGQLKNEFVKSDKFITTKIIKEIINR